MTAQERWLARRLEHAQLGAEAASALGLAGYRREQLYRAATRELVDSLEAISTIPQSLRRTLAEAGFALESLAPRELRRSSDGQTTKALMRLRDGAEVESVLMEHRNGRTTLCVSSQAGCAFGCAFCATGQTGFGRNLDPLEIFDQALFFGRSLRPRGKRITNVVFMGMGEPFHNYEAVMEAVRLLNDPHGFGLGHRHITISTVGLVPAIERFAGEGLQVNLAISLHAPTDAIRSQIMPVGRRYPLGALMEACARYVARTNRKIFFEYVMLAGINDGDAEARALAELMRGRLYHVNLIPYNATPLAGGIRGTAEPRIRAFQKILDAAGVPTTVRTPMGRDIAAACGQLRAEAQPRATASLA